MSSLYATKFPEPMFRADLDASASPAESRAYEILEPLSASCPLVFSSPHSGCDYPDDFVATSRLDPLTLRRSEDAHVDVLFRSVVDFGAPLLRALFPRAYVDPNREPYELDPRMFEGKLPPYANTRSPRVAVGLGTIPRVVSETNEIYLHKLPVAEALARIDRLYKPYHRALRGLLERALANWGAVVLVDCHSMPSFTTHAPKGIDRRRADVVLGDRFGTSCDPAIHEILEATLRAHGLSVHKNSPYAGGFITEHYGNPDVGANAIQIEINRALYVDEATLKLRSDHVSLILALNAAVGALAAYAADAFRLRPAAE